MALTERWAGLINRVDRLGAEVSKPDEFGTRLLWEQLLPTAALDVSTKISVDTAVDVLATSRREAQVYASWLINMISQQAAEVIRAKIGVLSSTLAWASSDSVKENMIEQIKNFISQYKDVNSSMNAVPWTNLLVVANATANTFTTVSTIKTLLDNQTSISGQIYHKLMETDPPKNPPDLQQAQSPPSADPNYPPQGYGQPPQQWPPPAGPPQGYGQPPQQWPPPVGPPPAQWPPPVASVTYVVSPPVYGQTSPGYMPPPPNGQQQWQQPPVPVPYANPPPPAYVQPPPPYMQPPPQDYTPPGGQPMAPAQAYRQSGSRPNAAPVQPYQPYTAPARQTGGGSGSGDGTVARTRITPEDLAKVSKQTARNDAAASASKRGNDPTSKPAQQFTEAAAIVSKITAGNKVSDAAAQRAKTVAAQNMVTQAEARVAAGNAATAQKQAAAVAKEAITAKTLADNAIAAKAAKTLADNAIAAKAAKTLADNAIAAKAAKTLADNAIAAKAAKTLADKTKAEKAAKTLADNELAKKAAAALSKKLPSRSTSPAPRSGPTGRTSR
jgi:hypothetical protein